MTIEEMKQRKTELGLSCKLIAQLSSLPLSTVQKVFSGTTRAPRKATIDALTKVLEAPIRKDLYPHEYPYGRAFPEKTAGSYVREDVDRNSAGQGSSGVHETAFQYRITEDNAHPEPDPLSLPQGTHTLRDYYALPDERRVELIDGRFYDMSAPGTDHQIILTALYLLFEECIAAHAGNDCAVLVAPTDVRLDEDERTMVQPDLLIVCRKSKKKSEKQQSSPDALRNSQSNARCIQGAPDLALEILSPSTRSKDMLLKLYKYFRAGVREYWIVDPQNRVVLTYDFKDDTLIPKKYTFEDEIPVAISDGNCTIDFSRVSRRMEQLAWIGE